MSRPTLLLLAIALFCGAVESVLGAHHATDRIIVKFKDTPALRILTATNRIERLNSYLGLAGTRISEPRLRQALRRQQALGSAGDESARLDRFFHLRLPLGLTVESAVMRLRQHPLIEYVEPDGIGTGGATVPNDPNFGLQWHHRNSTTPGADIHSTEAWDLTTGSSDIIVAVLDTGVTLGLSEFAGRLVPGYDFVNSDTNPTDDNGHGTAVAGVLCANANNSTLVAGMDWNCRLMPVKVLDQDNYGLYSDWADGIDYAVSNGCKVINLSAGGSSESETLRRAITNAIARGVIFVTITHNQGVGTLTFPGRLPESITIGATDLQDRRAAFSNYGPQIDLVAPGTNIYTASIGGNIVRWWGTSFSAPLVSGVCALMASVNPNLNQERARVLLALGAEDQVGDSYDIPGFDNYYGWGRLNAYNSVLLSHTSVRLQPTADRSPRFSWPSPLNAVTKQPYRIEAASSPSGPWMDVTSTGQLVYEIASTTWFANTNVTPAYYRLRLRAVP